TTVPDARPAGTSRCPPGPFCSPGTARWCTRCALLHLDARLGTHRAARFTQPDGLWDQWPSSTSATTPTTPLPSSAAGRTSTVPSPTAGPGRRRSHLTAAT
ncbi:DUF6000 family protein, partial [Streptomyces sp. NPDC001020]